MDVLGLDVGGANLKAAHTNGASLSVPFPLWKDPAGLEARVRTLIGSFAPFERLAVTMSGELCDCYSSQAEGVRAILNAVSGAGAPEVLEYIQHERGDDHV